MPATLLLFQLFLLLLIVILLFFPPFACVHINPFPVVHVFAEEFREVYSDSARQCKVEHLSPGQVYNLRVASVSDGGGRGKVSFRCGCYCW